MIQPNKKSPGRDTGAFQSQPRGTNDTGFVTVKQAALALLNGDQQLTRKAGQFLGQLAVDPATMSVAQTAWLAKLLDRAGLPPLARGGA